MKNTLIILLSLGFILFSLSCSDDGCLEDRQNIDSLKKTYDSNPTESNCIALTNAINAYLTKNCENPDQISYERIFESYLEELDCANPGGGNISNETCNDGILNGDETAIDCGGSVCPACPPAPTPTTYIRFDIDGTTYELMSSNTSGDAGTSNFTDYVFSQGNITDGNDFGAINVHYFQSSTIELSNFLGLIGFPIALNNPGTLDFADVELTVDGTTYSSERAGNTGTNSQLIVLQSSIEDSGANETYRVRGIFNCEVIDGSGNILTLENGTFELIFNSLP